MFLYKAQNKEIGCIGYVKETDELYKIKWLAVLTEYRHKGIGKRLLRNIEVKVKGYGGKIVEVHIVNNNKLLKEWYIKNAYKEIEHIDDLPFEVCIMQKNIKQK